MKTKIIATILLLPCLAVLNESESFIPNIIGILYICVLYFVCNKTKTGRRFIKRFYKLSYK